MENTTSTLQVQGFTPYAQVPVWIVRSGDALSHTAVRLYAAIMTYADNKAHTAFPSRESLAEDVGASVATVKRAIKELEGFGALQVERRRNKKTGNFYANHYTLVFENPRVIGDPRREVTGDPITKPTNLTTPTSSFTSDLRSDTPFHAQAKLEPAHRKDLVTLIHLIGKHRAAGRDWWDDTVQDLWVTFTDYLTEAVGEDTYENQYGHLIENTWTISATCADKYQAGAELNKMIASANLI